MKALIVSGLSGSGKTTAKSALEDLGFYCIDNLPLVLLEEFLQLTAESSEISKVALIMDLREKTFAQQFPKVFGSIKKKGLNVKLLFLETEDDVLRRRYSETRRKHPLALEGALGPGIAREKKLMGEVRKLADRVVDTSEFNVHQLKNYIRDHFGGVSAGGNMQVNLISFGYRHGVPGDLNLLFDARFLPNPYFRKELKHLPGTSSKVAGFVLRTPEAKRFLRQLNDMIKWLIPQFEREGKAYCSIGIGCTGGRHRSVALVGALAKKLGLPQKRLQVEHRDIDKGD